MAHTDQAVHTPRKSHTTPKDFFLWLGAIIAIYGSVTSFFALIFNYIDLAFPNPLEYTYFIDPLSTSTRVAMATLIILAPTMLGLLLTIRRDIVREPGKADIWVRRWALVLTIFIAAVIAIVDLITLLTTYLGGDLTIRFALKALVVLLLSVLGCLHFLADYWGYWTLHRKRVNMVGAAVGALAIMTVIGGFMLIGSPSHIRDIRYDQQRTQDLQSLQSQLVSHWQSKGALPETLEALNDALSWYTVPTDPRTHAAYEYIPSKTDKHAFTLCATFDTASQSTGPANVYYTGRYGESGSDSFTHGEGRTCFTRTIDPDKYPVSDKPIPTEPGPAY